MRACALLVLPLGDLSVLLREGRRGLRLADRRGDWEARDALVQFVDALETSRDLAEQEGQPSGLDPKRRRSAS